MVLTLSMVLPSCGMFDLIQVYADNAYVLPKRKRVTPGGLRDLHAYGITGFATGIHQIITEKQK